MDLAAAAGHLRIVQWLHFNRQEGCTKAAMDRAAGNGHLDVVKWLHFNRSEGCTTRAIDAASARCNAQVLDNDQKSFASTQDESRFEIIQFLYSHRTEGCTFAAMDGAARNGNLALMQWLHMHKRSRCSAAAMDVAAGKGYLNIVKWLHENRKEVCAPKAMDRAAAARHLEVVKWLNDHREEGCTPAAIDGAAANRKFEVIKWLIQNRGEGYTLRAMEDAAENGDLEMVKLLHKNSSVLLLDTTDREGFLDEFSDESPGDFVQLLYNVVLEEAASSGHMNVVRWLMTKCDGFDIVPATKDPIVTGHFEVLLYMHSMALDTYSVYDIHEVWDSLREGVSPQCNKEIVAWFAENYHPDHAMEREWGGDMDGMEGDWFPALATLFELY